MALRLLERTDQGLGQARLQLLQRLLDGREPSVGRVALLLAARRARLESELLLLRLAPARLVALRGATRLAQLRLQARLPLARLG